MGYPSKRALYNLFCNLCSILLINSFIQGNGYRWPHIALGRLVISMWARSSVNWSQSVGSSVTLSSKRYRLYLTRYWTRKIDIELMHNAKFVWGFVTGIAIDPLIHYRLIDINFPRNEFISFSLGTCRLLLEEHATMKSRKNVRWSAVPVAPMWVYVGVRWLEGQRPRRGRWPMLFLFEPQGWN